MEQTIAGIVLLGGAMAGLGFLLGITLSGLDRGYWGS